MRTTIHVDDQLLMRAKAQAAASGITLGKLIEDALRDTLRRTGLILIKNRKPVLERGQGSTWTTANRCWTSWNDDPV